MDYRLTAACAMAVLAGCADRTPDPRGLERDETLLSLSATGEAEAVPDLATMEVGVEAFARSAKEADGAIRRKSNEIAAALAEFGVEERDVQTRTLSIRRVDYGPRKGQFQASNILALRLRDVPRAGEALAAATAAGANVLSGPALQIADPEKANRGAYIAAYRAARTRAQAYADAAGMEVARVLTIRDGGTHGVPWPPPEEGMGIRAQAVAPPPVAMPPPPSIRPGTNRTRVAVQVDFALKPK